VLVLSQFYKGMLIHLMSLNVNYLVTSKRFICKLLERHNLWFISIYKKIIF